MGSVARNLIKKHEVQHTSHFVPSWTGIDN